MWVGWSQHLEIITLLVFGAAGIIVAGYCVAMLLITMHELRFDVAEDEAL